VARIDSTILHEIARIVQTRSKVPDRVQILKREYQITYLEDHRQRMEDALRRHDSHLLNMLFGQLASKVKYQVLRSRPSTGARKAVPAASASKRTVADSTARTPISEKKRTAKTARPAKSSPTAAKPAKSVQRATKTAKSAGRTAKPTKSAVKAKKKATARS